MHLSAAFIKRPVATSLLSLALLMAGSGAYSILPVASLPNVDFPVASLYYLMDIPVPLYTPIFVMSRVVGWSANIIEQLANNRIFRPQSEYTGPRGKIVRPIGER